MYPIIFKPEIGNTTGRGVVKINNKEDAVKYLLNNDDKIIAQKYADLNMKLLFYMKEFLIKNMVKLLI